MQNFTQKKTKRNLKTEYKSRAILRYLDYRNKAMILNGKCVMSIENMEWDTAKGGQCVEPYIYVCFRFPNPT